MRKSRGYWSKPSNVDKAYAKLKARLGRAPTLAEFKKECGGAIKTIQERRYNSDVRKWNEYKVYRGDNPITKASFWNDPINYKQIYRKIKEKLGRVPKVVELPQTMTIGIRKGKYKSNIKLYKDFVEDQEDSYRISYAGFWDIPENYERVYKQIKEKLGRVPKVTEFPGRMILKIRKGNYNKHIRRYKDFVEAQGDIYPRSDYKRTRFWNNPSNYDITYKQIKEKLKRVTKTSELPVSMVNGILDGKYDPNITSYIKFVEARGDVPLKKFLTFRHAGFWNNSENYKQTYQELKIKLKRIPMLHEIPSRMREGIRRVKYPSVKNYREFLAVMGDLEIKTIKDLEASIKQDKKLASLVALGDGKTSELASILTELFPERFKDERKLTKLLINSKIGKVVAPFQTQGSNIIPILELLYEENNFPTEVRKDIDNLVYDIVVDEYQPEFNANPEMLMSKLEKFISHENRYIANLMNKVKDYYQSVIDFKIPGVEE